MVIIVNTAGLSLHDDPVYGAAESDSDDLYEAFRNGRRRSISEFL